MDEVHDRPKFKKPKYETYFNERWKSNPLYADWMRKIDNKFVKCVYCSSSFTIKWDGEAALTKHLNSVTHKKNALDRKKNNLITHYAPLRSTATENRKTQIELASVYHGLQHNHSYLSMDCGIKLNSKMFNDSILSKEIHCGKTKAEAIVKNVLSPKSIEMVLNDIKPLNHDPIYFSIASDASNNGNRKLFPIVIQYFSVKNGIQNKLLDFFEDPKEESKDIYDNITKCLNQYNLDIALVSAYSADNANVNYGEYNSVYQKFLQASPGIVKANCCCHVIHNAGRFACKTLSFDVETLVLKVYAEFACSAKKLDTLKTFFEEFDMEYRKIICHVSTRWLSLFKCVDRLVLNWPALKSYFISLGQNQCEAAIWVFLDNENECTDDLRVEITFPEMYMYFMHHYMNILNQSILLLETKSLTSIELHTVMEELRSKIQNRLNDGFYGAKIKQALPYLTDFQRKKFNKEANNVYQRTIDYLKRFYDFEGSPYRYFSILNLQQDLIYDDVVELSKKLLIHINEDSLYDEVKTVNLIRKEVTKGDNSIDKKWSEIFRHTEMTELFKIISKVLSIPISNAFVERIFSLMNNLWTDERNNLSVHMVKAELCTKINFNMSCDDFLDFISKPEQQSLLEASQTSSKYDLKKNNQI